MKFTNEVRISGRATKDAIKTGNGPYRFGLAHGGGKKRDSEDRWPTEFFDISSWHDSAADIKKGVEVVVVGRLRQSSWERDGQKHSRVEIVATELTTPLTPASMTPPPEPPKRTQTMSASRPITPQDPITNEDCPF